MRRLLLALPFALLPLTVAQAASHDHEHEHHEEHGSLDAHEHGAAQLNVAVVGKVLELQLESPAMNLVGFEHAVKSDADKAKVAAARSQLEQPLALFGLSTGDCSVSQQALESQLFAEEPHEHEMPQDGEHSDIHALYTLDCQKPEELKQLDLAELFKRFPATAKIQVQLIGPNGQQGSELTPAQPTLKF
jgi:hypothetical protein